MDHRQITEQNTKYQRLVCATNCLEITRRIEAYEKEIIHPALVDVCRSTYYNTFEDDYSDQNESRASGAIAIILVG